MIETRKADPITTNEWGGSATILIIRVITRAREEEKKKKDFFFIPVNLGLLTFKPFKR